MQKFQHVSGVLCEKIAPCSHLLSSVVCSIAGTSAGAIRVEIVVAFLWLLQLTRRMILDFPIKLPVKHRKILNKNTMKFLK